MGVGLCKSVGMPHVCFQYVPDDSCSWSLEELFEFVECHFMTLWPVNFVWGEDGLSFLQ